MIFKLLEIIRETDHFILVREQPWAIGQGLRIDRPKDVPAAIGPSGLGTVTKGTVETSPQVGG